MKSKGEKGFIINSWNKYLPSTAIAAASTPTLAARGASTTGRHFFSLKMKRAKIERELIACLFVLPMRKKRGAEVLNLKKRGGMSTEHVSASSL